MRITRFANEAARLNISQESIRQAFEKALSGGKVVGTIDRKNDEFIHYESDEIDSLVERLYAGRVSVKSVAADLGLNVSQVRLIIEEILSKNRVSGVLTSDDTFLSMPALRQQLIVKIQENLRIDSVELAAQLRVPEWNVNRILKDISGEAIKASSAYEQVRIADFSEEIELPETVTISLLKKLIHEGTLSGHLDMINGVLTIDKGSRQEKVTERKESQLTERQEASLRRPSAAWYIVPLFFGLIGGVIGYLIVEEDDHDMASGIFWLGVFMSAIYVIIVFAYWSWIASLFRF